MVRARAAVMIFLFGISPAWPQSLPVVSPQAWLQQAVTALDGSTTVNDTTLEANVTYAIGPDLETGMAKLEAKVGIKGFGNKSKLILSLTDGQHEEIRSGQTGVWIGPDGKQHAMALHNCLTEAAWFFPGLGLQAALGDSTLLPAYVGPETRVNVAVQHVSIYRVVPPQTAVTATTASLIQRLSTMEVYLDAVSFLPVAIAFNVHPDNNAAIDLPVEIRFSNYQTVGGVKIPFHIQKFLQGNLLLDLNVGTSTLNSGVSDSDFALVVIGSTQ
jgi:hypothetical protein